MNVLVKQNSWNVLICISIFLCLSWNIASLSFLPSGLGHVKSNDKANDDEMTHKGATRASLIFHFFCQAIGAIVGGVIADNFGRLPVIKISLFALITVLVGSLLIESDASLFVNGVGGGLTVGVLHTATSTLFIESCSASSRHFQTAIFFCMQGVAHVFVRLIATTVIYFSTHHPQMFPSHQEAVEILQNFNSKNSLLVFEDDPSGLGDHDDLLSQQRELTNSVQSVRKLLIFKTVIICQIIPSVLSFLLLLWKAKESKVWLRARTISPPSLKSVSSFFDHRSSPSNVNRSGVNNISKGILLSSSADQAKMNNANKSVVYEQRNQVSSSVDQSQPWIPVHSVNKTENNNNNNSNARSTSRGHFFTLHHAHSGNNENLVASPKFTALAAPHASILETGGKRQSVANGVSLGDYMRLEDDLDLDDQRPASSKPASKE
eukprot:GDKK01058119.1.p1 GENE.GDKK01058119.1~~GDKK01058119.1.p1  ORF type:complete len:435 (+),score=96.94 GDKK01058119.1:31-1335(+)